MIVYLSIPVSRVLIFPMIKRHMAIDEPAPKYEYERSGVDRLNSTLELMQRDQYPDLFSKAAYMFCSIIDGHPFSNGNKRLAVAMLSFFLLLNDYKFHGTNIDGMKEELQRLFPDIKWHQVRSFRFAHEYFLYHLALVIADRSQKGKMTFAEERAAVETLIQSVVVKKR